MFFKAINIVANELYFLEKKTNKKYFIEKMDDTEKRLFEEAISSYGIGCDNVTRDYITIFISKTIPNDLYSLPHFNIKLDRTPDTTLYQLDKYANDTTRSADIFIEQNHISHINVDLAIADGNSPTYQRFSLPQTAQNVFKSILKLADFIGTNYPRDRHIRIVLHNENLYEDGKYESPPPLFEKIWDAPQHTEKIPISYDMVDTTAEEQARMVNSSPPQKIEFNFLTTFEELVKNTLNPDTSDYEMTDLSDRFNNLAI